MFKQLNTTRTDRSTCGICGKDVNGFYIKLPHENFVRCEECADK